MARIKIKPFGMIIMTFTQLQTTWLSILRWQMVIFTVVHLNWGHLNKTFEVSSPCYLQKNLKQSD